MQFGGWLIDTYRYYGSEIYTPSIPVDTPLVSYEEVIDVDLSLVHDEVRGYHKACHRAKENTVAAQDRQECRRSVNQLPWIHGNTQQRSKISTSSYVDIFWECRSKIKTTRESVPGNIDTDLGDNKSSSGEESGSAFPRTPFLDECCEDVWKIPQSTIETILRGCCDQDPNNRTYDGVNWEAEDLSHDRISRSTGETSIIILIQNASSNGSDGADDAICNQPTRAAPFSRWSTRNGITETSWPHCCQSPDQEHDLKDEDGRAGDIKEVSQLVRPDIYRRE